MLNRIRSVRWLRWLPAVGWMAVIFALSARSGNELGSWLPSFQRLIPGLASFDPMHYVAYFILALTFGFAFGRRSGRATAIVLNVAMCTIYGVTDEWHQSFVPNRTPDILDIWHDAIGAAAGALVAFAVARWRSRRQPASFH